LWSMVLLCLASFPPLRSRPLPLAGRQICRQAGRQASRHGECVAALYRLLLPRARAQHTAHSQARTHARTHARMHACTQTHLRSARDAICGRLSGRLSKMTMSTPMACDVNDDDGGGAHGDGEHAYGL
jgi:hypothetical protein